MSTVLTPPQPIPDGDGRPSVFLAGSIEMGAAENWQQKIITRLADTPLTILNPRREEWDSSWQQDIGETEFRQQVEWELSAQETAGLIVMYFAPQTKAPVTMLELGLFARSNRLVVCCPQDFWRKGNVDIVCKRYAVPMVQNLEGLVAEIQARLLES